MELKITADWVLSNIPHTFHSDGLGNVLIICDITDYHWVKLAFDELGITYDEDEIYDDDVMVDPDFIFEFQLDDIKTSCTNTYFRLLSIDTGNRPTNDTDGYIKTNNKTLTFEECESFINVISTDMLGILAKYLCIDDTAKLVSGFIVNNDNIYLDIDGKFTPLPKKEGE